MARAMVSQYQQSAREYTEILKAIQRKAPCKLLVYGVGKDSSTYAKLNSRGGGGGQGTTTARSLFVEHDAGWIEQVRQLDQTLEIMHVTYTTTVGNSLRSGFTTTFETGAGVLEDWDIIIVDAPPGEVDRNPGREAPIREASIAAKRQQQQQQPEKKKKKKHVDVFVHDVNREIEAKSCDKYLTTSSGESAYVSYDRTRHYVFGGEPPTMPAEFS